MNNIYGSFNKNKKNLYIINPKAANTTIINVLRKYGYTNRRQVLIKPENLNYTFTFVRNPYDRLLSRYFHLYRRIEELENGAKIGSTAQDLNLKKFFKGVNNIEKNKFNFKGFVKFTEKIFDPHWESQFHKLKRQMICLSNIQFIGRFESLQEHFDIVCDKIDIPQQKLPHKNKTKHKHYTEYYDNETRDMVTKRFAKDIEYFGYEFGE